MSTPGVVLSRKWLKIADRHEKLKDAADKISADCDQKLAGEMPIFEKAVRAIGKLKSDDVMELRKYKKATSGV